MRYFLKFAYNGENYFGYQIQPKVITVQEVLEKALSLLLQQKITIVAAGRTDSGVHAKEMYAHFDCVSDIDSSFLIQRLNAFLPKDIVVYTLIPVKNTAHARFDAVSRTYEYRIHLFKDAFIHKQSWHYHTTLDIDKMNEAGKILLDYIDFQCFSKVHTDVRTFNCKITAAYWKQLQDNELVFTITANRFLRNMVRAIVGTMIDIGNGKTSLKEFRAIIESKNRSNAGFSVPAHGLYLVKIVYPYI